MEDIVTVEDIAAVNEDDVVAVEEFVTVTVGGHKTRNRIVCASFGSIARLAIAIQSGGIGVAALRKEERMVKAPLRSTSNPMRLVLPYAMRARAFS